MDELKNILFLEDFEDITKKMQEPDVIYKANKILTDYKVDNIIKDRDFLSSFIIYKYPEEILGELELEINKNVYESVNNIFNDNETKLKTNIIRYIYLFKKWRNEDKSILIEQIFNEYHQLTLDILNCVEEEDSDKIKYFENVKNQILNEAENIGGEILKNQILSYTPVIVSVKDLKEQYDKAYWDKMKEDYENNNFDMIDSLLNFFKETFKKLSPFNVEELDVIISNDMIFDNLRKIKNDNNEDAKDCINIVTTQLFNIIKTFQSPIHDMELESYKAEIHVNDFDFVKSLKNMFILFNKTIVDLENIKKQNEIKSDDDDDDV
jgi:hypothetical protein